MTNVSWFLVLFLISLCFFKGSGEKREITTSLDHRQLQIQCGYGHGYVDGGFGNAGCEECDPGSFSDTFMETCEPCPAGSFSDDYGAGYCHNCDRGESTVNQEGADECTECVQGTYADSAGQAECTPCNAGQYGNSDGAISRFDCYQCLPGTYSTIVGSDTASDCRDCPAGTFGREYGSSSEDSCELCPSGTYGPNSGASSDSACVTCSPGEFSGQGQESCSPCERGTYSAYSGTQDECNPCGSGTYQSSTGMYSCDICERGYYCEFGATEMTACEPGTFNPQTGGPSCSPCEFGFYQPNYGSTECIDCPAGHQCEYGSVEPVLCEPGFYEDNGYCEICPEAFFSSEFGSLECTACPSGRVSAAGAIAEDGCVNPAPNFIMGYLSLGVVCITIFIYVSNGRFHRVAFIRKYRALNLIFFEARNVSNSLSKLVASHGLSEDFAKRRTGCSRLVVVMLWLLCTTVLIAAVVIGVYILVLSRVLFSSLLIWKGFNIDNLGFVDKMNSVGEAFADSLNIPSFEYLIWPFIKFIDILSAFKIDLGSVEVTCEGSQAPMELIINCFVLGFIVIIIESDYHVYEHAVFGQVNLKTLKAAMTFPLGIQNPKTLALKCAVAYIAAISNPLVKILQFAMSTLQFSNFVKKDYIMHNYTDACDRIAGLAGLDSSLAGITSLCAWYVVAPALYTLSKVVVPHGDKVPHKYVDIIRHENQRKYKKKFEKAHKEKAGITGKALSAHGRSCPENHLKDLTLEEFEEIVLMFNEMDSTNNGLIDEDEVTDAFFKLGFVHSESKTREMFKKADQDGNGEIDFDEFVSFIVDVKKEDASEFDFLLSSFGHSARSCSGTFMNALKSSSFVAPDLLMATSAVYWLNKLVVILGAEPRFKYDSILWSPFRTGTPDEHVVWEEEMAKSIPNYFMLCHLVYTELMARFEAVEGTGLTGWRCVFQLPFLRAPVSIFAFVVAYLLPFGHLTTPVGHVFWEIVVRKLFVFIQVCVGIWTDEAVEGYDLEQEKRIQIGKELDIMNDQIDSHDDIEDDKLLQLSHARDNFKSSDELRSDIEKPDEKKVGLQVFEEEIGDSVRMLIAPRAVILQIIPFMTFLSIYADICSDAPMFIPSEKARQYFPPLFIKDAVMRARFVEMNEANHKLSAKARGVEWIVQFKAMTTWSSDSRFFKILKNLFQFILVLAVLYAPDPAPWLVFSFVLLFPMIFISLLEVYVMTGKALKIRDADVQFFMTLLEGPAPGSGVTVQNSTEFLH